MSAPRSERSGYSKGDPGRGSWFARGAMMVVALLLVPLALLVTGGLLLLRRMRRWLSSRSK